MFLYYDLGNFAMLLRFSFSTLGNAYDLHDGHLPMYTMQAMKNIYPGHNSPIRAQFYLISWFPVCHVACYTREKQQDA